VPPRVFLWGMMRNQRVTGLLPESARFEGEMDFGKPVESEASNETKNEPIDEAKPDPKQSDTPPTPPIPPSTSKTSFPHEQESSNDTGDDVQAPSSRPRRAAAAKAGPGFLQTRMVCWSQGELLWMV